MKDFLVVSLVQANLASGLPGGRPEVEQFFMRVLNVRKPAILGAAAFAFCGRPVSWLAPTACPPSKNREKRLVCLLAVTAAGRFVGSDLRRLQCSQGDGNRVPEWSHKFEASARLGRLRSIVRPPGYTAYLADLNAVRGEPACSRVFSSVRKTLHDCKKNRSAPILTTYTRAPNRIGGLVPSVRERAYNPRS